MQLDWDNEAFDDDEEYALEAIDGIKQILKYTKVGNQYRKIFASRASAFVYYCCFNYFNDAAPIKTMVLCLKRSCVVYFILTTLTNIALALMTYFTCRRIISE